MEYDLPRHAERAVWRAERIGSIGGIHFVGIEAIERGIGEVPNDACLQKTDKSHAGHAHKRGKNDRSPAPHVCFS